MTSFLSLAAWILIGVAPGAPEGASNMIRQRVDMIELNHFVDEEAREVFQQVIFYDWSPTNHRFHVRAWRLIKSPSQMPERRWNPQLYQCTWHDDGLLRQVWAPKLRETWTQKDPERVNRAHLPEEQRIPLFVPKIAETEDPTTTH